MKTTLLAACAALVLGSLSATPATARDDTPAAKQSKPATHAPLQGSCTGDKKKHIKVCTLDDPVSGLRFVNWGARTKEGSQNNHAGTFVMPLQANGKDVMTNEAGVPMIIANPTSATANFQSKLADIPGAMLSGFANGGLSTLICVLGKCNRNNGTGVNNFIATQANSGSQSNVDVDVALANAIAVSPAGRPGGCPTGGGC